MASIFASFRYNLSRLARFAGRDSKSQFWPWAIFVLVTAYGAAFCVTGWAMMETVTVSMRVHEGELPESAAVEATAALGWLWQPLGLIAAIAIGLLAASVARRLHDRGRKGAWGLLPLPFLALSIAGTPVGFRFASGQGEISALETSLFVCSPLFYLALAGLLYLLAGSGEPQGNRFGPPPRERP